MKKKLLIAGCALAFVFGAAFGITSIVSADTTYSIDIGDTTSEEGYTLAGWGTPAPSQIISYAGHTGDLRTLWGFEESTCTPETNWASVTLPSAVLGETITSITIRHLDGAADDSFDVYINDVNIGGYASQGNVGWLETTFDVSGVHFSSNAVIKLEATASAWAYCSDWGQVAIDRIDVETFLRSAEITSPTAGEYVSGMVDFDAVLVDKDGDDNVQWAVREGTCAAGTGTVFGNVDGYNDHSTWDYANFHAQADTTLWNDGNHCFVFNPTESSGDIAIRETRNFVVDNKAPEIELVEPVNESIHSGTIHLKATCDETCDYINFWWTKEGEPFDPADKQYHYVRDGSTVFEWDLDPDNAELWNDGTYEMEDGIYLFYAAGKDLAGNWARSETHKIYLDKDNDGVIVDDLCPGTIADAPYNGVGTNRWAWNGTDWETDMPKGLQEGPNNRIQNNLYTIEETYGCSCSQILERMEEATGEEFGGHWKYGCSKSILEDWIDGKYYLETVEVPANDADGVESLMSPIDGQDYWLKAYNTADAGDTIEFDAMCSITNRISGDTLTDSVSGYTSYGPTLLDLFVDGVNFDWGDTCSPDHTYLKEYTGKDLPVEFHIYDIYPSNNTGSLFVDIFAKLW